MCTSSPHYWTPAKYLQTLFTFHLMTWNGAPFLEFSIQCSDEESSAPGYNVSERPPFARLDSSPLHGHVFLWQARREATLQGGANPSILPRTPKTTWRTPALLTTSSFADFDWSSSNEYLLSSSLDKTVRVWNATKGDCIRIVYGSSAQLCCCFNPVSWHFVATF
jgi:WD40 repeat protein